MNDAAIQALREAVRVSPNNVPLRQHFADTLMSLARYAEAEQEFKHALSLAPDNVGLKLGLARAFMQQDKNTPALVVVEDLLKQPNPPGLVHVLHARLLVRAGEIERAVREYKTGIGLDPEAVDLELAGQLGIGADANEDEVFEGRVRSHFGDEGDSSRDVSVERPKIDFRDV